MTLPSIFILVAAHTQEVVATRPAFVASRFEGPEVVSWGLQTNEDPEVFSLFQAEQPRVEKSENNKLQTVNLLSRRNQNKNATSHNTTNQLAKAQTDVGGASLKAGDFASVPISFEMHQVQDSGPLPAAAQIKMTASHSKTQQHKQTDPDPPTAYTFVTLLHVLGPMLPVFALLSYCVGSELCTLNAKKAMKGLDAQGLVPASWNSMRRVCPSRLMDAKQRLGKPPKSPPPSPPKEAPRSNHELPELPGPAVGIQARPPPAGAAGSPVSQLPDPICKELTLPACKARYTVITWMLLPGNGPCREFDVLGLLRNPLLHVAIKECRGHYMLEISPASRLGTPLVQIQPPYRRGSADIPNSLQIISADDSLYGILEPVDGEIGVHRVLRDGHTVVQIRGSASDFNFIVTSGSGVVMATVGTSQELFGEIQHVDFRIQPGVDAVLIMSCLTAILMIPMASRSSAITVK